MPESVTPGSSITLSAIYQDPEGFDTDPTDQLVSILDPNGIVQVTETPTRDDVGLFHFTYTVPNPAQSGPWQALWTGVVGGQSVIPMAETFDVVQAFIPIPPVQPVGGISLDELAAFQEFALPWMTAECQVFRPAVVSEITTAMGYDPTTDFGDDEPDDPDAQVNDPIGTVFAWFFHSVIPDVSSGSGQIGTIDVHEARFPIGTDIRPYDILRRMDSGEQWVVADTDAEDTYTDMLRASIRRRE